MPNSRLVPYLVIDKSNLKTLRHFPCALSFAQFLAEMTTPRICQLIIIKFEIRVVGHQAIHIDECRNETGAFSIATLADYILTL